MSKDRLPRLRRRLPLPDDLTKRDSLLSRRITLASEVFDATGGGQHARDQIKELHESIRQFCPHYHPDPQDRSRIMCAAGYKGKQPPMGHKCATGGCMLSQVMLRDGQYVYLGGADKPASVEDQLVTSIFGKQ